EAARFEVEAPEVVLEVDVEPLALRVPGACHRATYELGSDPPPTCAVHDHRVEHERVDAAVPGDIDEPDQCLVLSRAHPAETVRLQLTRPVVIEDPMAKRRCMQLVDLGVREPAPPFIGDRHAPEASRRFTNSLREGGTGFTQRTHGATRKPPVLWRNR